MGMSDSIPMPISEDAKRLAERVLAEMVRLSLEGEAEKNGDVVRDCLASILDGMWISKPGPVECICGKTGETDDAGLPIPPFGMVCFFAPSRDAEGRIGHTKVMLASCSPACAVRGVSQLLKNLLESVKS